MSWRQGSNNFDNPINPEYEQEARLVEQARAGSERAFSALLARYQQPVFRLIYYLVGNEHDARELTRIALKHSLRRMPRVPSGYSIRPWLLRVASLVALEAVRERHESPQELIATLELPPPSSGPTIIESDPTLADTMLLSIQELSEEPATVIADAWDRLPVDIERELIRRIMATLPENDAELLALGVVGQVPTRDLAAIAGTSQRSIRRRIARALILFQGNYQSVRTAALPAPPETKELPAAAISGITAINAITRRSIAEATDMVRRGWNGLRGLGTTEAQERLESLRDDHDIALAAAPLASSTPEATDTLTAATMHPSEYRDDSADIQEPNRYPYAPAPMDVPPAMTIPPEPPFIVTAAVITEAVVVAAPHYPDVAATNINLQYTTTTPVRAAEFMTVSATAEQPLAELSATSYAEYDEKTRTITTAISEEFRSSASGTNFPIIITTTPSSETAPMSIVIPIVSDSIALPSETPESVGHMKIEVPPTYVLPRFGPPRADVAAVNMYPSDELVMSDVMPVTVPVANVAEPVASEPALLAADSGITLAEIEEEIGHPPEVASEPVAPLPVWEEPIAQAEPPMPVTLVPDTAAEIAAAVAITPLTTHEANNVEGTEVADSQIAAVGAAHAEASNVAAVDIVHTKDDATIVTHTEPDTQAEILVTDTQANVHDAHDDTSIADNAASEATSNQADELVTPLAQDLPVAQAVPLVSEQSVGIPASDAVALDTVALSVAPLTLPVEHIGTALSAPIAETATAPLTPTDVSLSPAIIATAAASEPLATEALYAEPAAAVPTTADASSPEITPEILAQLSALVPPTMAPTTQVIRPQERTTYLERHRPTNTPSGATPPPSEPATPAAGVYGSWLSRSSEPQPYGVPSTNVPAPEPAAAEVTPVPLTPLPAAPSPSMPPPATRTRTPTRPMPRLDHTIIDPSPDA